MSLDPQKSVRSSAARIAAQLIIGAFVAYFSMYAFRRPFAVAQYAGEFWLGTHIKLKTALVLSQLLGYATSKFLGIRWCSATNRQSRAAWLIGCIAVSQAGLLAAALLPPDWMPLAMFVNGLPLGMVWGFVVGYLEGRRAFETLIAGLSCSFILASGMVKDIGAVFLQQGASERWMPAAVGFAFLPLFLAAVWLLERAPDPSPEDIASRSQRAPMTSAHRRQFLATFGLTLTPLILLYLMLSAFREYRDNYGIEIFQSLGYAARSGLFTRTEIPVTIGVFGSLVALGWVRENRRALAFIYIVMVIGLALLGTATFLQLHGHLSGFSWMFLIGLGSYLAYAPFGAILFDRLVAAARAEGNAMYAIYVAESFAYLGVVAVQLQHDLFKPDTSRLDFLRDGSVIVALAGIPLVALSAFDLFRKFRRD